MALKQLKAFLTRLSGWMINDRLAAAAPKIKRNKDRLQLGREAIETAAQLNGGIMTDSFERYIAARAGRFRRF
jgi:hypothetical protein